MGGRVDGIDLCQSPSGEPARSAWVFAQAQSRSTVGFGRAVRHLSITRRPIRTARSIRATVWFDGDGLSLILDGTQRWNVKNWWRRRRLSGRKFQRRGAVGDEGNKVRRSRPRMIGSQRMHRLAKTTAMRRYPELTERSRHRADQLKEGGRHCLPSRASGLTGQTSASGSRIEPTSGIEPDTHKRWNKLIDLAGDDHVDRNEKFIRAVGTIIYQPNDR